MIINRLHESLDDEKKITEAGFLELDDATDEDNSLWQINSQCFQNLNKNDKNNNSSIDQLKKDHLKIIIQIGKFFENLIIEEQVVREKFIKNS